MQNARGSILTRRNFLRRSLAVGGGVIVLGARPGWADEPKPKATARWAFVSDTHIAADPEDNYRGFYPYRNLQKVVDQIGAVPLEGTIITGDLARLTGEAGDYENAKKLLAPIAKDRPVCVALGNHDNRANFNGVFANPGGDRQPVRGKHVVTVDAGPARLVVLDSLFYVNQGGGLLGKAQRQWLAGYLQSGDEKPVILFFHHPPTDSDGDLLDTPWLFDIIAPIPKVKAIVCGHWHVYGAVEYRGITVINLPATGYNFGDSQPVGWVEAAITGTGCELTLHSVGGNTAIDGQTRKLLWRS